MSTGPESLATASAARHAAGSDAQIFRGLLWRQWLAQRNLVVGFFATWLLLVWVLLIAYHPHFVTVFGLLYAVLAGGLFGGADAAEGSEEFSFALPPTRRQRYLARLALGLAMLLFFTAVGALAVRFSLPQRLWGLVVESGFTEPFRVWQPAHVYWLAVVGPATVFSFSFALAAAARSPVRVIGSWVPALVGAAALLGLGYLAEWLLWGDVNGLVAYPGMSAMAAMTLLAGYLVYVRKEGVSRPVPIGAGARWWVAVVIVVALLVLLATATYWMAKSAGPAPEYYGPDAAAPTVAPTTSGGYFEAAPEEEPADVIIIESPESGPADEPDDPAAPPGAPKAPAPGDEPRATEPPDEGQEKQP